MPPYSPPDSAWRGHRDPRARLHTLIAKLAPACDVQQPPRSEADILRQLRGISSWHVLGTRPTQSGLTIRLARSPDERTGTGPFIRDGWRIVRAVVQATLHYKRTDDGRYVLTCRAVLGCWKARHPVASCWAHSGGSCVLRCGHGYLAMRGQDVEAETRLTDHCALKKAGGIHTGPLPSNGSLDA